jgi:hypothetical protein
MPFAYFFTESEGFVGSRKVIILRCPCCNIIDFSPQGISGQVIKIIDYSPQGISGQVMKIIDFSPQDISGQVMKMIDFSPQHN